MFHDLKVIRPWIRQLLHKNSHILASLLKVWAYLEIFEDNNSWEIVNSNKESVLLAIYHGEILPLILYCIRKNIKLSTLVSLHGDGEIIARVLEILGIEVFRGSTNYDLKDRGGVKAYFVLKKALKEKRRVLAITVDGPKGPPFKVKNGIIYLAKELQLKIYPVRVKCNRCISLSSWDRFKIPIPTSKIEIVLGKPLENFYENSITSYTDYLETALLKLGKI
jgi:lysophospholipid acyltransferase (LPLAT)-like uncharacterized protein